MAERIVVLDAISESVAQKLRALLPEGFELDHGTAQGDDHLAEIIAEADYAITGQVGVSRDVLQAAQRLKLVHKWGVGVDNIDVAAARECGSKIARTTGSNEVPRQPSGGAVPAMSAMVAVTSVSSVKRSDWTPAMDPGGATSKGTCTDG